MSRWSITSWDYVYLHTRLKSHVHSIRSKWITLELCNTGVAGFIIVRGVISPWSNGHLSFTTDSKINMGLVGGHLRRNWCSLVGYLGKTDCQDMTKKCVENFKQTDRQTDRQTDKQTHKQTRTLSYQLYTKFL